MKEKAKEVGYIVGAVLLVGVSLSALIIPIMSHISICSRMILDEGSWIAFAFLVFGMIAFPVGWIHGLLSMVGMV